MPRSAETLVRAELIGRRVRVDAHTDPTLVGVEGAVTDETMHTIHITTETDVLVVAKRGAELTFNGLNGPTTIPGDAIEHRPEDRTKKARLRT